MRDTCSYELLAQQPQEKWCDICHIQFSSFNAKDKEQFVSEEDALWAGLAARVIRVALERKGVSYAQLADTLSSIGVKETERSLISRVSRGTVKLTLLLQIIEVTGALPPSLWASVVRTPGTWEGRSKAVVAIELARRPWVTPPKLAALLTDIGVDIDEVALTSQLSTGTMTLSLFLQCITVLGSSSLDRYIDFPDLASAVLATRGERTTN
ncbi:MAG: hypothetical protein GAK33_01959 [Burkholderia lata]|uniref:DUF6471 domain-containing protein n=1 Tax=Burkholderia lata (strain ATCC 17760 / DSM 23089 / LMG 22485 / NCIMB 9086 / R18194 / 383) TaxID=482957 RepID=A0A833PV25_BURL3|nr:DUF6471 domain-containing protein [Burkholderia lata]KAF1038623.1 MAG: hypothetical protein GAK33_01959 [Burkholderia lata]